MEMYKVLYSHQLKCMVIVNRNTKDCKWYCAEQNQDQIEKAVGNSLCYIPGVYGLCSMEISEMKTTLYYPQQKHSKYFLEIVKFPDAISRENHHHHLFSNIVKCFFTAGCFFFLSDYGDIFYLHHYRSECIKVNPPSIKIIDAIGLLYVGYGIDSDGNVYGFTPYVCMNFWGEENMSRFCKIESHMLKCSDSPLQENLKFKALIMGKDRLGFLLTEQNRLFFSNDSSIYYTRAEFQESGCFGYRNEADFQFLEVKMDIDDNTTICQIIQRNQELIILIKQYENVFQKSESFLLSGKLDIEGNYFSTKELCILPEQQVIQIVKYSNYLLFLTNCGKVYMAQLNGSLEVLFAIEYVHEEYDHLFKNIIIRRNDKSEDSVYLLDQNSVAWELCFYYYKDNKFLINLFKWMDISEEIIRDYENSWSFKTLKCNDFKFDDDCLSIKSLYKSNRKIKSSNSHTY